jgi:hypothetical protein
VPLTTPLNRNRKTGWETSPRISAVSSVNVYFTAEHAENTQRAAEKEKISVLETRRKGAKETLRNAAALCVVAPLREKPSGPCTQINSSIG